MQLVQADVLKKWEAVYASGSDKRYPSLELVRLEYWLFGHPGQGKVLEYACGTGVNTLHLLECGYEVHGVDAAQGAIDLVRRKLAGRPELAARAHLSRIEPDARALPFADASFDFVVAMSIMSLLGSESAASHLLGEFRRVLKPGGKIILDINDHDSEFSTNQEQVEPNVFLFRGMKGQDAPVRCFCLPDEESFRRLIEPHFHIVDSGNSAHKLFGRRINEWIVSAVKD
jgi:ubiquinone/menaquinone biosynthesis C-methylase UbiE